MEIRDKKGSENVVADHPSHFESAIVENAKEIINNFLSEQLWPWYANFVNYLACNELPPKIKSHQKRNFSVMLYLTNRMTLYCLGIENIKR